MYYLVLDEDGYLLGHRSVLLDGDDQETMPVVESLDGLDLDGVRLRAHHWDGEKLALDENRLAALEEANAVAEQMPSPQEQLRADVDFIAAMTGVEL